MFESLTERLQSAFKRLSGKGLLRDGDVRQGLKEVRLALLEADVNYKVVKDFCKRVEQRSVGQDILKGLNPTQQIVQIVHEELVHLLGDEAAPIDFSGESPAVVMLCGLQGTGKTTMCGKLASRLQAEGRRALLVAADIYRPAGIEQLETVGEQVGAEVFQLGQTDPVDIAKAGVAHARQKNLDTLILDTAGRLHIDDEMMQELERLQKEIEPNEVLLVVDAMTGQDAVTVADNFGSRLQLDGVILTKLDSDARGGSALSVRAVTGKPIKFVGIGEKLDAIDVFHPDRMASRILGMGDVLSLIERAQQAVDTEEAQQLQQRILRAEFDLEDFRNQLRQVRKMGPLDQVLGMMPGAEKMLGQLPAEVDERELDVVDAIINSMTKQERRRPDVLNGSRKRRIARGSGTSVQEVNIVLKQYREAQRMLKGLTGGKRGKMPGIALPPV